jgi:hypothetical protein
MENTLFKKAKLATAIALVSTTTLLTGCLVDGDKSTALTTNSTTSETGNNSVRVSAPVGTVMGTVIDTNGNPIVGATVFAGNRSTTTSDGGTYELANIPVTGIEITDKGDYLGGSVRLVIVPPAGFLGGIVTVQPSAVLDNGRSDQGTTEETSSGSTNNFIDGFTAVAGEAVLPAIGTEGATVTGVLRNNVTHEPIANQTLNLELKDVNGSAHTGFSGGEIAYTTVSYPATTAADGSFTLAGLPNDSDLTFIIGGHHVNSVTDNVFSTTGVVTNDEVEVIHVGNVFATAITNDDTKSPFVTAIEEVTSNVTRAKLHDDTTSVLTVHFSEPVVSSMIDVNSVIVRDLTADAYIPVTVVAAADARSMTITALSDFTAGSQLDIYMLKVDFQDIEGNLLDDDDTLGGNAVKYDFDDVDGNTDYAKLQVEVYRELNQNAAVVTNLVQATVDDSPLRLASDLDNASSTFADVDMAMTANGIQQLNTADATISTRITTLINALNQAGLVDAAGGIIYDEDGIPETDDLNHNSVVEIDVARVSFTPSNASDYMYRIERNGIALNTDIVIDSQSSPDAKSTDTGVGTGTIEPQTDSSVADFQATAIAFTVSGVNPGDMIYIQSMDDFGNPGSETSITLADNVPVTTSLQDSYGEQDLTSSSVYGSHYGNGGELSNLGDQALIGVPLLNINAGMLSDQGAVPTAPTLDSLFAGNKEDSATNSAYITAGNTYDSTAYTAWSAAPQRTIGVSFTENVAWVTPLTSNNMKPAAGAANSPATTATAGLSAWGIMNDVTETSDEQAINVDLAVVTVSNIFTLGNVDGQNARDINFNDVVTDPAGNLSTNANAKVVINDALPPIMTQAVYSKDATTNEPEITLTFNEVVKISTDDTEVFITIGSVDIFLHEDTIAAHNAAPSATVTIPFTTATTAGKNLQELNRSGEFTLGDYDDAGLTPTEADTTGHVAISYVNVQDNFGNTWAEDHANVTAPVFAGFDALGTTELASATAIAAIDTVQTVTFTLTHPIDVAQLFTDAGAGAVPAAETDGTIILDDAQVNNLFSLNGAGQLQLDSVGPAVVNASGVINATATAVTITFIPTAILATADELSFSVNVNSTWTTDAETIDPVIVP